MDSLHQALGRERTRSLEQEAARQRRLLRLAATRRHDRNALT